MNANETENDQRAQPINIIFPQNYVKEIDALSIGKAMWCGKLKVRVQYLGYIRNMLKKEEEEFELGEGASLSDLLNKLAGIHGDAFTKEVFEPGLKDVKTGFVVTVNGVLMGQLHGVDTRLNDGDSVILMSLMSGG